MTAIEKFKEMGKKVGKKVSYYEHTDYEIERNCLIYWLCFLEDGKACVHVMSKGRVLEETITPAQAIKRLK